jgi:AcrR family transcriptional regulator
VGARARLDRAAVIQAAAALADEKGCEALTLADLAARLGVRTPSLYNHVAGLADVRRELGLLGGRALGAALGRAAIGKAKDEALLALAAAYRDFAKAHPGLYAAAQRAPDPADREAQAVAQEVVGIALAVLAPYRLRDEEALHTVRGLRSIVHGFVTLETAGGFGLPLDLDESFRRLLETFIGGLRQGRAQLT